MKSYFSPPNNTKYLVPSYTLINPTILSNLIRNDLSPISFESHLHFIFYCNMSKTVLDFISGLINLNYTFNTPFKVSPKAKLITNGGFIP